MEKAPPFVVPAGVVFEIRDDGVTIENRGDILLHTTFGRMLRKVVSAEGSIEIHGDVSADVLRAATGVKIHGGLIATGVDAGGDLEIMGDATVTALRVGGSVAVHGNGVVRTLHAGGAVTIRGNVTTDVLEGGTSVAVGGSFGSGVLRAAEIHLGDHAVTARGIQASRSVSIGAGKLQVDAIIAPSVEINARASGRVTIIECQNELGPNALKGKLRLADYQETFGDPAAYLAERGLTAPGESEAPPVGAVSVVEREDEATEAEGDEAAADGAEEEAHEASASEDEASENASADDTVSQNTALAVGSANAGSAAPSATDVEIEESEDAAMGSSVPAPAEPTVHPMHGELVAAVAKIVDCYAEAEVPPAVSHLQGLIASHSYEQVRAEITTIWTDLLKFHHKKGLRIQHQVTTTFNTINSLVKKM